MQRSKNYSSSEIEAFFAFYNNRLYRKAMKYLQEKRFDDVVFDGESVTAIVHGEHGDYVAYIGKDGAKCGCPASRGRGYICYHLIALAIYSVRKGYFSAEKILKLMRLKPKKYEVLL